MAATEKKNIDFPRVCGGYCLLLLADLGYLELKTSDS